MADNVELTLLVFAKAFKVQMLPTNTASAICMKYGHLPPNQAQRGISPIISANLTPTGMP